MLREPRGAGGGGSWFQGCAPPPRGAAEVLPARPPPAPAHPGSSARAQASRRRLHPCAGRAGRGGRDPELGARSSGRVGLPGMLGAPRPGAIYSSRASRGRDGWCPGGPPDLLWLPHLPPKYNGGPASVPGRTKGLRRAEQGRGSGRRKGKCKQRGGRLTIARRGPCRDACLLPCTGAEPKPVTPAPALCGTLWGSPGPHLAGGIPMAEGDYTGWRQRGPGHRPRPAGGALRGTGTPTR